MIKPIAVISGDIHYNLKNLEVADLATRQAILRANSLDVPFISNGDLHDEKSNLRAECVNRLIETFKLCREAPYINIGNHSLLGAKSKEHAINFLKPYANVIESPTYIGQLKLYIVPYHDDADELRRFIRSILKGQTLVLHQGLVSGNMGDYIQDHSALSPEDLKDHRSILSHYHARQDIKCGDNIASYIGSPYTTSFGEANDLPKGFQILMSDGSLEFVPTNLRKHVIVNIKIGFNSTEYEQSSEYAPGDILKVRVSGTKERLAGIGKKTVGLLLSLPTDSSFNLEFTPTDNDSKPILKKDTPQSEILDSIIDNLDASDDLKARLKKSWRSM